MERGECRVVVAVRTTAPVTAAVARYACGYDFNGAPAELFERATRAVIDTVGVAIAGRQEPSFTILAETLGAGRDTGEATVLPTRARASASHAALLNGTAGHALDFDDVTDELKGHPSVVLVSALLAVAEARACTGREFLEASPAGYPSNPTIERAGMRPRRWVSWPRRPALGAYYAWTKQACATLWEPPRRWPAVADRTSAP